MMCAALILILGLFEGHLDWGLILASETALLELMVVVAYALFFSSMVVTPTLAGLFTAAVFVAGRSAGYLKYFSREEFSHPVRTMAQSLYWLLPHLDRFNIADQVVYGSYVDLSYLSAILIYAVAYSAVLLMLSVALFSRREFT